METIVCLYFLQFWNSRAAILFFYFTICAAAALSGGLHFLVSTGVIPCNGLFILPIDTAPLKVIEYESARMWDCSIIAISEAGYFRLWMYPFVRVIDILSRTFTIGISNNRTETFLRRDIEFSVPYLDFLIEILSSANESCRLWMFSNMYESECYHFRKRWYPIVDLPFCESHRFFIGDSHNRITQQSRTYRGAIDTILSDLL